MTDQIHKDNVRFFNASTEENKINLLNEFHDFIKSKLCPNRVKLQYHCAKYQYFNDKPTNESY